MSQNSLTQQQRLLQLLKPDVPYPPGLRDRLLANAKLLSFSCTDGLFVTDSRDRYVYHYTKARTAAKILNSGRLRMSPFAKMNDPRENKDWVFNVHTQRPQGFAGIPFAVTDDIMRKRATAIAKDRCKLASFAEDNEAAVPGGIGNNTIYARGFCRARMWSQYGDEYAGVCLLFDRHKLHQAIERSLHADSILFHGAVAYRNKPQAQPWVNNPFTIDFDSAQSQGLEATVGHHVQRYWRELFFEKCEDWSNEREFRWLIWGGIGGPHYVPFADSLKAIVVGHRFDRARFGHTLTEYCKEHDINAIELQWQNGVPGPNIAYVARRLSLLNRIPRFRFSIRHRSRRPKNAGGPP